MKIKDLMLVGMFVMVVVGGIYHNARVNSLESKLAKAVGHVDTLTVTLQIRDTVFVEKADTVIDHSDTTVVGGTVQIHHWPALVDNVQQPLFDLRVSVDTKRAEFQYNFMYKPLALILEFTDKFDLRKGFQVTTVPDIGTVSVDWGDYRPLKRAWGVSGSLGLGYSKIAGVFMLGEVAVKGVSVGAILQEGGMGVYMRKTLFTF